MRVLAIETCTDACSAALLDNEACIEKFDLAPRRHAQLILPMVESLLGEAGLALAQIDVVAFSRGPGAFTGVRIGAAVAQGIALGADLPVVPVSTLEGLARRGAVGSGVNHVAAALDARMSQVYAGLYQRCGAALIALCPERLATPGDEFVAPPAEWLVLGSGWDRFTDELAAGLPGEVEAHRVGEHPHAADIAYLGAAAFRTSGGVSAEDALPVYLRDRVTHV